MKTLKVIVNSECNLTCGYCTSCVPALNVKFDTDMLQDDILKQYDSFLITGGEPTLIGSDLNYVIERLLNFSNHVTLNSNCVEMDKINEVMDRFNNLMLAVSFDGISSRGISNYDTIKELFMKYGERLLINYTIDWFNIKSLYNNIELLLELGISIYNIDIAFINVTDAEYSSITDQEMAILKSNLRNLTNISDIINTSLFSRVKSKRKGCGESGSVMLPNGKIIKCQPNTITYNTPIFNMINNGGNKYVPMKCRTCKLTGCGICVTRAYKQTNSIDKVADRFCEFNHILFEILEELK